MVLVVFWSYLVVILQSLGVQEKVEWQRCFQRNYNFLENLPLAKKMKQAQRTELMTNLNIFEHDIVIAGVRASGQTTFSDT